ncbi:hypothetical protein DPMN_005502 [Dreissena polymorpha]|uniref:Uncharacterized protein n=1 Tax=Dreissena polymorpha TaxID=45954 RepID=A0A9D4MTL8_DREPO|nr:hypothetical protein DPMN_005502 [Dreissena polymorpha]
MPLNSMPGKVFKKNGSTITVEHQEKLFRLYASHFKPVQTDVHAATDYNCRTTPSRPQQSQRENGPPL